MNRRRWPEISGSYRSKNGKIRRAKCLSVGNAGFQLLALIPNRASKTANHAEI